MAFPMSIQNYFSRIFDVRHYERLEGNRLELRKLYCLIALGLAEDVPMSGLSIYYLVRSLDGPPLPSRTPAHPILCGCRTLCMCRVHRLGNQAPRPIK